MHVLQWIAVDAPNEDEAMSYVESFLNNEVGSDDYNSNAWFDWFVIGGGRWNPEHDPYSSSTNMIISLEEDGTTAFEEKIAWCLEARKAELKDYIKDFDFSTVKDKLDSFTGNMQYDFSLHPLKKAIDIFNGEWDYNSYYFDMTTCSTNPKWALERPERNWYLVPVDFHF